MFRPGLSSQLKKNFALLGPMRAHWGPTGQAKGGLHRAENRLVPLGPLSLWVGLLKVPKENV